MIILKNIFVYIGSRNKNSRLFKYTEEIIKGIKRRDIKDLTIEVFSPLTVNLYPSTGCKRCFQQGKCPSEELIDDEGKLIKEKMEKADIIILASPVYSHNVSSDMKVLIDRLSYWAHLFKLSGKAGMVITTAESNGADFVSDYLEKILSYMGASVELKTNFINSELDLIDAYIEEATEVLEKLCSSKYSVQPMKNQETTFQTLKLILKDYPKNHFEYRYWEENKFFTYDSYEELLNEYAKN